MFWGHEQKMLQYHHRVRSPNLAKQLCFRGSRQIHVFQISADLYGARWMVSGDGEGEVPSQRLPLGHRSPLLQHLGSNIIHAKQKAPKFLRKGKTKTRKAIQNGIGHGCLRRSYQHWYVQPQTLPITRILSILLGLIVRLGRPPLMHSFS